ncbi:E3 ubiquitin-protein ligase TRIM71-like [Mytilus edulis]|uniref:E3 ubiquitin-protein ligase TRIM71-like n=1 Tax=Mytilus edulis TaxID=6550 RepID=UPI0039EF5A66
MATASFCDPCSEADKSLTATKYCANCEERLCTDCAESHCRFKAFKFHHVIDLSAIGSNKFIFAKKNCNVHSEMILDYYCTDHEIVCCKSCISNEHRLCQNVLPLELASKDVRKSALFNDVMEDITHLITTLNALDNNRQSNLQSMEESKSAITKQIRAVKSKLLKQIDELERELTTSFSSLQRKHEMEINKQKQEISQVLVDVEENKNKMDFFRDHGSKNQLFVFLRQQVTHIDSTEAKIQQMLSNSQEINIIFDEKKDVMIESLGSLLEYVQPCLVQYKPRKCQQAQIKAEPMKYIIGFEKDTGLKLEIGETYALRDVTVTNDNKLLITNTSSFDPKLYVYRDCKDYETEIRFSSKPHGVAVIPGTDKAVITLPNQKSIQFINTKDMTKSNTVNVGFTCVGITAVRDRIYVGGVHGVGGIIKILDTNGSILKTIKQESDCICFIGYDGRKEKFIVRCLDKLLCIKLDGTLVYSKAISGISGITLDRQGNLYFCDYHGSNIQRISSGGKCSEKMLNKDNGISQPYGMSFNNDFTKLFVINNQYTSVCVYKCKYL